MKKFIIILIIIINLFSLKVNSTFTSQQIQVLSTIATNCNFQWNSYECNTLVQPPTLQSSIKCDINNQITEITIQANTVGTCVLPNNFDLFPNLISLVLIDINAQSVPKTIYQHPNIQTLKYTSITVDYFVFTTDDGTNDWSKMVSLKTISITKGGGVIPKFPNSINYFLYEQGSATIPVLARVPYEIFTSNLTYFYLVSHTSAPASEPPLINTNIFNMAPNLITFVFSISQFQINLSLFYKPPPSLTSLQLYIFTLTNTTIPQANEVKWDNLQNLAISYCGLTGTIDSKLFFLKSLQFIYFNGNTQLTGTIPNNIYQSTLSSLYLGQTAITGKIPPRILEGSLKIIDLTGTNLVQDSLVPSVFLCIPPTVFQGLDITYKIFIPDNVFKNFKSISTRDKCVPNITSITSPIRASDSNIEINGDQIGSFTPFTQVQMTFFGVPYQLYCQSVIVGKKISCANPNFMGNGDIILTVKNNAPPSEPVVKTSYHYDVPSIYSITQLKTQGGNITLFGQNLWLYKEWAFNINTDYVKLIKEDNTEVLCTNLQVKSAFTTISCTLPPGIMGGNILVSVNNQTSQLFPFTYQGPVIKSIKTDQNNLIPTKSTSSSLVTINGYNFWNQSNLVDITLNNNIECTVKSIKDHVIVCSIPPSLPFVLPDGLIDLTLYVNGQSDIEGVEMIDPSYCPNNCGLNGKCNLDIGQCDCLSDSFGPVCSQSSNNDTAISIDDNIPILTIKPHSENENSTTSMSIKLISIIENQIETKLTNSNEWNKVKINDTVTQFKWTGGGQSSITVTIRENLLMGRDEFISYPMNSFTYTIEYGSGSSSGIDKPQFQFEIESKPYECSNIPFLLSNPTGKSFDTRYFTLSTFNTQYFGRFPKKVLINNDDDVGSKLTVSTITTTNLLSNGQLSKFVSSVDEYSIKYAKFQFDFTTFKNAISREPITTGCVLPTDNNSNITTKSNNGWKIGVGIGVGIAGIALVASGFLIIKQQRKYAKTNALLEKKLKEINHNL